MKGFTTKPSMNALYRGFSLIELMIAMSLSLLLMLGIYKTFDFQQRGFYLIDALNEREDNAQLAMQVMSNDIRMAGHWGGVSDKNVTLIAGSLNAFPGDCNQGWVFDIEKSIYGVEGNSTAKALKALPSACLSEQDYKQQSDLLSLRFGDSREYFEDNEIDNKRYQKHYFLRTQSGNNASLFQGYQTPLAKQAIPDNVFHYNMLFHSSLYFLKPCQKKSKTCAEGDSVLTRLMLKGNRYTQEALVGGIEQLQFEYGIDENKDKKVDHYFPANKVTSWQSVLSVRIFLLVRSRLKDKGLDEKDKIYAMNSMGSKTVNIYQVPEKLRHYPRKLYQREVSLRNRLVN